MLFRRFQNLAHLQLQVVSESRNAKLIGSKHWNILNCSMKLEFLHTTLSKFPSFDVNLGEHWAVNVT